MSLLLDIYQAYNAAAATFPDGGFGVQHDGTTEADRAMARIEHHDVEGAYEHICEAADISQVWLPLADSISLAREAMEQAWGTLWELAGQEIEVLGELKLVRADNGEAWLVGKAAHLMGEGGPAAMDLYDSMGLEDSNGVTFRLVNPVYVTGWHNQSGRMRRTVQLELAEPVDVDTSDLQAIEAELNKKGWSMG